MRKLGDIITAIRDGEKADYEELRYAVCAMDALLTFDRVAFMHLAEAEQLDKKRILTRSAVWQYKENADRVSRAMDKTPKAYVGWDNDPDNPEFLVRRKESIRIMEAVVRW